MMTTDKIDAKIRDVFESIYPMPDLDIKYDAEMETITVTVDGYCTWTFEIPSDDDGYFYFQCDNDPSCILKFPYPES